MKNNIQKTCHTSRFFITMKKNYFCCIRFWTSCMNVASVMYFSHAVSYSTFSVRILFSKSDASWAIFVAVTVSQLIWATAALIPNVTICKHCSLVASTFVALLVVGIVASTIGVVSVGTSAVFAPPHPARRASEHTAPAAIRNFFIIWSLKG